MNSIPTGFRPMLAATITEDDLDKLRYPIVVQEKIDGIRCIVTPKGVLSRRLKLIPNKYIREKLSECLGKDGVIYDGELILQNPKATFQEITSAVMSQDGEPEFHYRIFDVLDNSKLGYTHRMNQYQRLIPYYNIVDWYYCLNKLHVIKSQKEIMDDGAEGIILRDPASPYKFGRSTIKQQYLLKLKPFVDAEAEIIGMEPKYHNANPTEYNELGYAKHSSHGDGLVALPMMGALKVRGINGVFKGVEFNVGSGFNDVQRKDFWKNKSIGKIITYKYQSCGSKDKPRCPVFKGIRKD